MHVPLVADMEPAGPQTISANAEGSFRAREALVDYDHRLRPQFLFGQAQAHVGQRKMSSYPKQRGSAILPPIRNIRSCLRILS